MKKKTVQDTRQHIVDVARALMSSKGYTAVGLAEIVMAAGIPKGSFYYYFKSKEEFGQALLEDYFATYLPKVDVHLRGPGSGRERLMAYFQFWADTQGMGLALDKCLVVKLGPEVCDLSEDMRLVLRQGTEAVVSRIAQCIEQGQADGSIGTSASAPVLASALYQLWLGASLLGKVGQSVSFDTARIATEQLLV
ncbi:TetR/AcrR family transcriptional regulator [Alcaligenes sp. 13f]|uniref:TetR/AcrR family transcriptional regulator n=1 Tax=Alcaligenes sp. 13f TaxID=2841924 RepID=UPI001CF6A639|nr:TetR/AcrR family transcriptional regulator [Alcaligenes sp. 13f]MCB4321991.1 TetR/AcrR family transcriptional regulator [Alcaligenes sp. 13f]